MYQPSHANAGVHWRPNGKGRGRKYRGGHNQPPKIRPPQERHISDAFCFQYPPIALLRRVEPDFPLMAPGGEKVGMTTANHLGRKWLPRGLPAALKAGGKNASGLSGPVSFAGSNQSAATTSAKFVRRNCQGRPGSKAPSKRIRTGAGATCPSYRVCRPIP